MTSYVWVILVTSYEYVDPFIHRGPFSPTGSAWRAGAQKVRCARANVASARSPTCMPAQAEAASDGVAQMTPPAGTIRRIGDRSPRGAGRASINRRTQSGGCDRLCLQRRRTLSLSGIV